jgi:hypothetical protein
VNNWDVVVFRFCRSTAWRDRVLCLDPSACGRLNSFPPPGLFARWRPGCLRALSGDFLTEASDLSAAILLFGERLCRLKPAFRGEWDPAFTLQRSFGHSSLLEAIPRERITDACSLKAAFLSRLLTLPAAVPMAQESTGRFPPVEVRVGGIKTAWPVKGPRRSRFLPQSAALDHDFAVNRCGFAFPFRKQSYLVLIVAIVCRIRLAIL